jgi:hypothetical protein
MMSALREHAEAMAWAIENGLEAPRVALNWACLLVAEQADPPEELIELAGAIRPHPAEVVRLLRQLPGSVDRTRVLRKLFARYLDLLRRKPDALPRVTADLERMTIKDEIPEPLDGQCRAFNDALSLAEQGIWGDVAEIRADVLSFLETEGEPESVGVLAFATRWSDSAQPGWVECVLVDTAGDRHVFVEKVPAVTSDDLNEHTAYPQPVVLDGAIVEELVLPDGSHVVKIDTTEPWNLRTTTGETVFVVARERLIANRSLDAGPLASRRG